MPFDASALKTASEQAGFDEPPPPDLYEAELVKAEVFQSKAGEDWLRFGWKVLTGRRQGHEWSHIQALERYKADGTDNEGALAVTARILGNLGIDVVSQINDVTDLPKLLDPLLGGAYTVEVKRNGNFVNTTPHARLESFQTQMPPSGYGDGPLPGAPGNAIFKGDDPAPAPPPDVPSGAETFRRETAPKKGDLDPETGEPIPF